MGPSIKSDRGQHSQILRCLYGWPHPAITIPSHQTNRPTTYRFECSIVRFGISSSSVRHQLAISSSSARHQLVISLSSEKKGKKEKEKRRKREKGKKGKRGKRKREKGKKR